MIWQEVSISRSLASSTIFFGASAALFTSLRCILLNQRKKEIEALEKRKVLRYFQERFDYHLGMRAHTLERIFEEDSEIEDLDDSSMQPSCSDDELETSFDEEEVPSLLTPRASSPNLSDWMQATFWDEEDDSDEDDDTFVDILK